MNKNFLNAIAVSVVLHASMLTVAQHEQLLGILKPIDDIAKYQEKQSAMNFTFVESPSDQMVDEPPARKTNMISDKSTAAADKTKAASPGAPESPHVEKTSGGKQIGKLAGVPEKSIQIPDKRLSVQTQPTQGQGQKPAPQTRPVMKALPADQQQQQQSPPEEQSKDAKPPQEDLRLKEEYTVKVKELQQKIDQAQKKIKENEELLRRREQAQKEQEEDLLRKAQQQQEQKQQQQQVQQQEDEQPQTSKGRVGLGGMDLHDVSSDIQGDVERFGELSFNANRYELGAYFKKLKTKVEEYWLPYLAFVYGGNSLFGNSTVVFFKIMPDGSVKDVQVLKHSGDDILKEFCLSAVTATAPYDPLPLEYLQKTNYPYLPIVFYFNY